MNLQRSWLALSLLGAAGLFCPAAVGALELPFTEDFDADAANWVNFNSSALLDFQASGGPDGSSYASGGINFVDLEEGDDPVVLRATTSVLGASSDGALFGDWITDGVTKFSTQVRHNAPVPLTLFTRYASPLNFPGGSAINFAPVLPNVWTKLEVEISPTNPQFVTFEGQTFADVFDDVGNIQIAISNIPESLAGVDQEFTFDIDQPTIVPEPANMLLLWIGMATMSFAARIRNG